ncbi:MAG: hypothetical protein CVV64_19330 [Candidatus Wallbacteria bacterium HGW-Wallbacteria-1]|jgi:PAS domain S-box-containing protein|uniref:histidine kinase n=1 Tax=Candidatus Wallbacteria bacterium HGW-Wallbacteria-1 TaxID=2013854 RepID=A0A2N1PIX8_9BACT|nr:MAG: hypothetical protein CVV64_19330 [Candidatus Wallbacteria bacterium HGW-Wallbacteria-1]
MHFGACTEIFRAFTEFGESSVSDVIIRAPLAMDQLLAFSGYSALRLRLSHDIPFWPCTSLDITRTAVTDSSFPDLDVSVFSDDSRWDFELPLICLGNETGRILARGEGCSDAIVLAGETLSRGMEYRLSEYNFMESEKKFRTYVELSNDCIWAADLELNWHYISPSVFKLRGLTPEEAMQENIHELFTPESAQVALTILGEALEAIRKNPYIDYWPLLIECEEYRKDGSTVWCEITASFTKGPDGRVIGIQGVTRDIDERKRTQLELIKRMEFENIISGLSTNFVNLPLHELQEGIRHVLSSICEFLGADTGIVFIETGHETGKFEIVDEWNRPGKPQHPELWQQVCLTSQSWWLAQLRDRKFILVDDTAMVPDRAAPEKELFALGEIASVASIPLAMDRKLRSFLALAKKTTPVPWSSDTPKLLEIAGQLMVNILNRIKIERELECHRLDLESLVQERTAELVTANMKLKSEIISRSEAEEALRRSESRFRAIFESASDCIAVWNMELSFMYANSSAKSFENRISINFLSDLFSEEQAVNLGFREFFGEKIDQVIQSSSSLREVVSFTIDGKTLVLDTAFSPIKGMDGGIFAVVALFRDITDRVQLENELLKAKKIESIGVLAGGIAHDFNNLLTSIMLNLSLAKLKASSAPESKSILEKIAAAEKGAHRSKELADQLLTFARGGAPVRQAASLTEIIRECAGFTVSGLNVKCEFDFEAELKPAHIDPGQIAQVLNNIIINAAQAMPDGGIIRISARNASHVIPSAEEHRNFMKGLNSHDFFPVPLSSGPFSRLDKQIDQSGESSSNDSFRDFLLVSVEDQGCGIGADAIGRIFDPYFTTKTSGNGLGLALSYSIIKKHGGTIEVFSEPGAGSRFDVYLPAAVSGVREIHSGITRKIERGTGSILIMDDESEIRDALSEMLSDLGYSPQITAHGAELIDVFSRSLENGTPPDLLILDLTIPGGMGGAEAISRIRNLHPEIRAIASSGYSNDEVLANFRDFGFVDIIPKPYEIVTLSRIVARAINSER